MILFQHHTDFVKTSISGIGAALRMGGMAIALLAVCVGVSSGDSNDVFEDAFAPVPWQASPRSSRIVDSSQWRGTSQRSASRNVSRNVDDQQDEARVASRSTSTRRSVPQSQSRSTQSGLSSASKRRTAAPRQTASKQLSSARRVKPVAYNNIVQSSDEGYVLDPVVDDQVQGPIAEPMQRFDDGMSSEPIYGACGDPAMEHAWQGGEYWFNPRYGMPPFMCRFPHWLHWAKGRLWFRGEYLGWWMSGSDTPALVTSSPVGTAIGDAGVLYESSTTVLFGDEKMNNKSQSGGRYQLGYWLDDMQCFGWELNYFEVGESKDTFATDTNSTAIFARPFTNTATGGQASIVLSYPDAPNDREGSVQAETTAEFRSFEFLLRRALFQRCEHRVDVVFGYRYGRLDDKLTVNSHSEYITAPQYEFDVYDRFQTRNRFNGAEIGVILNKRTGRWGMEFLAKLALGRTSSRVEINGATTITNGGTSTTYQGGLLALPSNSGVYKTKELAVMPEIGANLMWWLTPRASFTFGYTLVYLSHVARPGDQIDMMVNTSQFPPGTISGAGLPNFQFRTTDFWAHGMNIGFDFRF